MNALDFLKKHTTVVADTGDFLQLAAFAPQEATTNPSLILKAVQKSAYAPLLRSTVAGHREQPLDVQVDQLLVRFGCEILKIVPGRVSTEVDARLSFDTAATVARAQRLIRLYRVQGIEPQRVLIKIAATWEGIAAAAELEKEGIHTNLTLVFAKCQAVASGAAGVSLISPFVGRIYDWHKKRAATAWNEEAMSGAHDPGVRSVREIYHYFKYHGIKTEVMGASFRNTAQIMALCGCDLLTISPELLCALEQTPNACTAPALSLEQPWVPPPAVHYSEAEFRYALNADACASEKLAEGIRAFVSDTQTLEELLRNA